MTSIAPAAGDTIRAALPRGLQETATCKVCPENSATDGASHRQYNLYNRPDTLGALPTHASGVATSINSQQSHGKHEQAGPVGPSMLHLVCEVSMRAVIVFGLQCDMQQMMLTSQLASSGVHVSTAN